MKKITPNPQLMRQHIEFILSGMSDYSDGRFHIAWGMENPNAGRTFAFDEIDEAIKAVTDVADRVNVYICGSIFNPEAPHIGRVRDEDFYATSVLWADIDQPTIFSDVSARCAGFLPNMASKTSTAPGEGGKRDKGRYHLWWKLSETITDPETLAEALTGLSQNAGDDETVINPARLMRLAGTINFPSEKKRNREDRQEDLVLLNQLHAVSCDIDALMRSAPARDYRHHVPADLPPVEQMARQSLNLSYPTFSGEKVADGRELLMTRMVYAAAIHMTAQDGSYADPFEVADKVWPVYRDRVVSNAPGGIDSERGRNRQALIQKARYVMRRFEDGKIMGFPDLNSIVEAGRVRNDATATVQQAVAAIPATNNISEAEPRPALTATPLREFAFDSLPQRDWLYGTHLICKYTSMTVAAPGTGKSTLAMLDAMSVACGEGLTGTYVHKQANTWIYNLEDPLEETEKRFAAACIKYGKKYSDFAGKLFFDSGRTRDLIIMQKSGNSSYAYPDKQMLIDAIRQDNIGLLVVDPFISAYEGDENNNKDVDKAIKAFNAVAEETGCAIELIHHTGKSGNEAGNANSGRGGSAMVGAVRVLRTLITMSAEEAQFYDISANERYSYVRVDGAKANMSKRTSGTKWLKLEGQYLRNGSHNENLGDEIAVMVNWEPTGVFEGITRDDTDALLLKIEVGTLEGNRYSKEKNSGKANVFKLVERDLKVSPNKARLIVSKWCESGKLYEEEYKNTDHKSRLGLYVRPDEVDYEWKA